MDIPLDDEAREGERKRERERARERERERERESHNCSLDVPTVFAVALVPAGRTLSSRHQAATYQSARSHEASRMSNEIIQFTMRHGKSCRRSGRGIPA